MKNIYIVYGNDKIQGLFEHGEDAYRLHDNLLAMGMYVQVEMHNLIPPSDNLPRNHYAKVVWTPEDIYQYRRDDYFLTTEECCDFLDRHEELIQEAMIEAGWDVISACLDDVYPADLMDEFKKGGDNE